MRLERILIQNKSGRENRDDALAGGALEMQVVIRAVDQTQCEQCNEDLANGSDGKGPPALFAEFPQTRPETNPGKSEQESPAGEIGKTG